MRKNIVLFLLLISLIFIFTGCEQLGFKGAGIEYSNGLIVVRGKNTVTGTMTINPGTTVRFEETSGLFGGGDPGELEITSGGKIIAQGTAQNPVIMVKSAGRETGYIIFRNSASNESILEYCNFSEIAIKIENTIHVQRCKFSESGIEILKNSTSLIQNNSFNSSSDVIPGEITYLQMLRIGESDTTDSPCPLIYYNNLNGSRGTAIVVRQGLPEIKYNNITNAPGDAVSVTSSQSPLIVDNNYIANCNDETGVDTTGEQSYNVTYTNPQTSPVSGAGCGW